MDQQAYKRIQLAAANTALVDDKSKRKKIQRFTAAKTEGSKAQFRHRQCRHQRAASGDWEPLNKREECLLLTVPC